MSDIVIVVPARFGSTRFPGKPLTPIRGAGGDAKLLVQRSWEAALRVRGASRVIVATDDMRIADAIRDIGGEACLTSAHAANGTERCAELLATLDAEPGLLINFQGDALLTPAAYVEALIAAADGAAVMTPAVRCDADLRHRLFADANRGRIGGTTVVTDRESRALYFSRRLLPCQDEDGPAPMLMHVGVYAYPSAALRAYAAAPPSLAEQAEGLEQLRFLDFGWPVRIVEVDPPPAGLWEVNNPEDVPLVEASLAMLGLA
jgi:3-deoxy-manno-octulosonate cytidylyltransferase (CMP-KDO synthetase)